MDVTHRTHNGRSLRCTLLAVVLAVGVAPTALAAWGTTWVLGDRGGGTVIGMAVLPEDDGSAPGATVAVLRDGDVLAVQVPGEEDSLGATSEIMPRAARGKSAGAPDGTLVAAGTSARRDDLRVTVRVPGTRYDRPRLLGPADRFAVAAAPGGAAAVAWTHRERLRLVVRPAGGAFGAPVDLGAAADQPAVALAPDGRALVLSGGDRPRPRGAITLFELLPDRTLRSEELGHFRGDLAASTPRLSVVAGAGGAAVAMWQAPRGSTAEPDPVLVRRRAPGAPAFAPAERLATTATEAYGQDLALLPDGRALAVLVAARRDTGPRALYATRTAAGLGPFGALDRVSRRRGPRDASSPALAVDRRGDALVAWSSACAGCDTKVVAAAARGGGRFGQERALSDLGARATSARVALGEEGRAAVGWTSSGEPMAVESRTLPAFRSPGDVRAPRLRLSARREGRVAVVRVRCGEPCYVRGHVPFAAAPVRSAVGMRGRTTLRVPGRGRAVVVTASDDAGNVVTRGVRIR